MSSPRITRAREFRRDSRKPEKICWELLRNRRLAGIKFRRQHPIGPYFADFACLSAKLVIEVDGEHHAYQVERDSRRTAFMESPEGIWVAIELALKTPATPSPSLSP